MEDLRRRIARIDRERLVLFGRFLLRRFLDDRCFESAGALAYTTMFALVPFTAVVLSMLSAFPVFDDWTERVIHFVFVNFVPASARAASKRNLRDFAQNAQELDRCGRDRAGASRSC